MISTLYLLLVALAATTPAKAEPAAQPSPSHGPAAVVAIQLDALRDNDVPYPDAGIARTWSFAHPANRAVTGPLSRFTGLLKSAGYRDLLGHRSHEVVESFRDETTAGYSVTIQTTDNRVVAYAWTLERVTGDTCDGCWMTTGVATAAPLGESI